MKTGWRKDKIVVIIGPTASGKSALAIELAKKYGGEVISADSRQVYRGMDKGSGKVTKKEMAGVPHHMLDMVSPRQTYSVARYTKDAQKAIGLVRQRNRVPIVCGGTGFYIDSLIYETDFPQVPPNPALRKKLETYSTKKLYSLITKKDPVRANNIDKHNKVRLIRALEIIDALGTVPSRTTPTPHYNHLIIGIETDPETLKENIRVRLQKRLKIGMKAEVQRLHNEGISWKRLDSFGLEYRFLSRHLRGLITAQEMTTLLETEIWHYTKRQLTWFKRNKDIHWFPLSNKKQIFTLIDEFLFD